MTPLRKVAIFIRNGASIKQEDSAGGDPITRIETIAAREVNLNKCGYADVSAEDYNKYILDTGDILISHINSTKHLGKCAIYKGKKENVIHGMNLLCLRPNKKIADPAYVYFMLSSSLFLNQLPKITKNSVNQSSFNVKSFDELEIPLPPLEIQKQIAAVLEKADQLRKDCKQMEQELNSLVQSVFIDMFGDPVTNPKGWEVKPFSAVADVVTGNTPSRGNSEYYGPYIEWIKSGNINTPSHYLTVATEYLSEKGKLVGRSVEPGAVLMTCIAGSPECIGNIAIADREVTFNQQINALVPKKNLLNTEFLYVLIIVGKKIIQSASTNSMKGMISKGKLEEVRLPYPSYEKQCEFSKKFKKLEVTVTEHSKQVIESEAIFNSLMQKAFKGELSLKSTKKVA